MPVRPKEPPRAAPLLTKIRPATPQFDSGLVEVGDPSFRIRRVDRNAEGVDELAVAPFIRLVPIVTRADHGLDEGRRLLFVTRRSGAWRPHRSWRRGIGAMDQGTGPVAQERLPSTAGLG